MEKKTVSGLVQHLGREWMWFQGHWNAPSKSAKPLEICSAPFCAERRVPPGIAGAEAAAFPFLTNDDFMSTR